jgi:predicted DNA-binding transcriptional regulator AlpA
MERLEHAAEERRGRLDRRDGERRSSGSSSVRAAPPVAARGGIDRERRDGQGGAATREPIRSLTLAVETLTRHLAGSPGEGAQLPTCTVGEAAALLGTTPKGIYALYERGKLPKSIGPGRRLVFLREELLQFARRASPSGGHGR